MYNDDDCDNDNVDCYENYIDNDNESDIDDSDDNAMIRIIIMLTKMIKLILDGDDN